MAFISGLISGLDTTSIVDGLIELERAPINRLEEQKLDLQAKLAAWQALNLQLVNFKVSGAGLSQKLTTGGRAVSTSDATLVTAQVAGSADIGTHTIKVKELAQGEENLAQGIATTKQKIIGSGTITLSAGNGTDDKDVNGFTKLSFLNGGTGVSSGSIQITDRSTATATIDLSSAQDIQDVLDLITGNTSIKVTATLNDDGDGIKITDNTGLTNGNLKILEVGAGTTAANLGIKTGTGGVTANEFVGTDLNPRYSITVDNSNNTLEGIRDAIIQLKGPFSASIINDGSPTTPFRLSVTSKNTGTIGALTLTSTSNQIANELTGTGDGTLGAILGDYSLDVAPIGALGDITQIKVGSTTYTVRAIGGNTGVGDEVEVDLATGKLQFFNAGTATNVTGEIRSTYTPQPFTFTEIQAAKDANVELGTTNPVTINSHTNILSGAIAGLNLTLLKADATKTVQVNVQADITDLVSSVKSFVDSYNGILTEIRTQNSYDVDTLTKGGPLFGDVTLVSTFRQITTAMTDNIPGLPDSFKSIFQIGISVGSDGTLVVDDQVLTDKLTNNLEEVKNIFSFKSNISSTATFTASSTGTGFDVNDLKNNITSSANFGADPLEGWRDDTSGSTTDYVTVNFNKAKFISQFSVYTLDSLTQPATTHGIKDYDLQYLKLGGDPVLDADWITISSIKNNKVGKIDHFMDILTTQMRLKITGTNAADGYVRLVELESYEPVGAGVRTGAIVGSLTNVTDGTIVFEENSLEDQIKDMDESIARLEERLDLKEQKILADFARLESTLGQLQTESDFLSQAIQSFGFQNK